MPLLPVPDRSTRLRAVRAWKVSCPPNPSTRTRRWGRATADLSTAPARAESGRRAADRSAATPSLYMRGEHLLERQPPWSRPSPRSGSARASGRSRDLLPGLTRGWVRPLTRVGSHTPPHVPRGPGRVATGRDAPPARARPVDSLAGGTCLKGELPTHPFHTHTPLGSCHRRSLHGPRSRGVGEEGRRSLSSHTFPIYARRTLARTDVKQSRPSPRSG